MSFDGTPYAGFENDSLIPQEGTQGILYPKRNIGGLVANVVVEETHQDDLEITQHPVEKSADITDHAYKLPARCRVRVGYSPAGSSQGGAYGDLPDAGDPVPLQTRYEDYLQMQEDRELLEVQTGKRFYENMLIRSIQVVTDADTENALMMSIDLQQVILVETQTVTVPPNSVQKQPKSTATKINTGVKQAAPNPPAYNVGGAIQAPVTGFSFGGGGE